MPWVPDSINTVATGILEHEKIDGAVLFRLQLVPAMATSVAMRERLNRLLGRGGAMQCPARVQGLQAASELGRNLIVRKQMKSTSWIGLGLLAFAWAAPFTVFGFQQSARPQLPNFDRRAQAGAPGFAADAQRDAAAAQLRTQVAGLRIDLDPLFGTPKSVSSTSGFLTGPNGEGKSVRVEAAAAYAAGDPYRSLKAFLDEHAGLFGVGAASLAEAEISRDHVSPHSGLRTVVWQQQLNGISVFDRVLIGNVTKNGELVSVGSQFLPDLKRAAEQGMPNWAALAAAPPISASEAIVRAAPFVDAVIGVSQIRSLTGAQGVELRQELAAPALSGPAYAKLVWLPLNRNALRLCWDLILVSRARGEMFRVVVDAQTGEVMLRRCLTNYLTPITLNVYTSDSPSPFSPGHATPSTIQPPVVSRTLLTLSAISTNASPLGWIDDSGNQTMGNNVDAHTDLTDDDQPDLPRPQGSPARTFNFPLDLAQSPLTYTNAAVVQLFYWNNFIHDKLWDLGFTEAAGNFQSTNFNRGGLGNDAVQADAQDGALLNDPIFHANNANFATPPDGFPPRMQMYVFDGPTPYRDGDLDAEVVLHEYTHGLSNRRVGGGVGISELQPSGMGEGWSDFYALSLLSEPSDNVDGNYASGGYVTFQLGGLTQNYYFGIRRYPYSTDLTKNPLTFKDIDPTQASAHTGIPRSPIFGPFDPRDADEVHNQGEVWCAILWEVRANLVKKWGGSAGNQLALQLVTDGMSLCPVDPTYIQARDAIIQADLVKSGGANFLELWRGFAKRGMGLSAVAPANFTTVGVVEAFDVPGSSGLLSINDGEIAEGNGGVSNAVFTVSLLIASTNTVTVTYVTGNGSALAGSDYQASSGTLSFPPGTIRQTVSVPVMGDQVLEPNETFFVNLTNANNAVIAKGQGKAVILNDDGPVLSVGDATVVEGDSGVTNIVFTVSLSQATNQTVTVSYVTSDGTATSGSDYYPTNGLLSFAPGVTNQTVLVQVIGDAALENDETFFVNLTNATGVTIFKAQGVGTIQDDEARLFIDDVTVTELDVTTNAVFKVYLTKLVTNVVKVNFATANVSATAGLDYVAASGSLIFPAGVTNQSIVVPVLGDLLNEATESFVVNIFGSTNVPISRSQAVGTILDNDPLPGISITNLVGLTEGNSGTTTNAVFAVRLTSASGQLVTVDFSTGVGDPSGPLASSGVDYVGASGTLVFPAGITSNGVPVTVIGDGQYESNETFSVRIFNPVRATNVVGQNLGYCTITNDDSAPVLSVSSTSVNEGDAGITLASFTVSLSVPSGLTISANFATADQSAGASDYVSTNGTVTFTPGTTTQTINVPIVGDTANEANETFLLKLTNFVNAVTADNTNHLEVTGTILNDDGPTLSITDLSITEGNSGTGNLTFTVSLSPVSAQTVTVDFATTNGTATAGSDYGATTGTLTFPANTPSQTITVSIVGETAAESNEVFYVNLSNPLNATIKKSQGAGTIVDDDTLADLALLVIRSSPTEWNGTNYFGHTVTNAITVTNQGPFSATNVVVSNVFSTGVTLVSATNSQGTFTSSGSSFVFDLGVIESNASATATLVFLMPVNTARLTNSASVSALQPDSNLANNTTNVASFGEVPFVRLTNNASAMLTGESVTPPNGAIDPGETVTLEIALLNSGNVRTTNLVVTLLATNGVNPITINQTYGVVAPNATVSRPFVFQAASGGTIAPVLNLTDGSSNLGSVTFSYSTGTNVTFVNAAALTVPALGPATPAYPSTITVSNLTGVVNKVTVTLSNVTHSFPSDLDIVLVGPSGANVMLMSDVSVGDNPVSGVTLTFDDASADALPEFAPILPGAYRPTNYGTNDVLTGGPAGPFGTTLSVFRGLDGSAANGAWSLYVVDDANGDGGSIGGWSLAVNTVIPVNNTAELSLAMSAQPNPVLVGSNLVYVLVVTNHGPKTAQAVTLTDTYPPGAVLTGVTTATGTVATNGNTLTFSLGSLASGASLTNTITVANGDAGTATNYATVSALETDLNQANNTVTRVTQVNRVLALMSQSGATLTNGFGFAVVGQSGLSYVIEVSTNLVQWTPILTNPPTTNGVIPFVDTNVPASGQKFYRALER